MDINNTEKYFYGNYFTNHKVLFIDSTGYGIEQSIPFVSSHIARINYGEILMTTGTSDFYNTPEIVRFNIINNTIDTVFSFNENIEFFYQVSDEQLIIATLSGCGSGMM